MQLVDLKMKFDDLNWQKQTLEEKLRTSELAEIQRRKLRRCRDDVAKKEREAVEEEQVSFGVILFTFWSPLTF